MAYIQPSKTLELGSRLASPLSLRPVLLGPLDLDQQHQPHDRRHTEGLAVMRCPTHTSRNHEMARWRARRLGNRDN